MGTLGFRGVYIVTFWLCPSGLQPCVGLPLMELHMTLRNSSRTSPCTLPADPGSAVVAHAESSGGACSSGITRCPNCGAPVANYLKFSACTNPECDAPYYRAFQPTQPAFVAPAKPKTFCGLDRSDWSLIVVFLIQWGLPLVIATAALVWLSAPACEEPFFPLILEGCK